MNDGIVLVQDKGYNGKIGLSSMNEIISNFKALYFDLQHSENIVGFEINGGIGLTKGAHESFNNFVIWCQERGLRAIYNDYSDLYTIRKNLRILNDNKSIINIKNR